jgi:hypothetical protein
MKGMKMKKNANEIFPNGIVKSRKKIAAALFGLLLVPLSTGSVRGVDSTLGALLDSAGALIRTVRVLDDSVRVMDGSIKASDSSINAFADSVHNLDNSLRAIDSSAGALAGSDSSISALDDGSLRALVGSVRALVGSIRTFDGSDSDRSVRGLDRSVRGLNISLDILDKSVRVLDGSDSDGSVGALAGTIYYDHEGVIPLGERMSERLFQLSAESQEFEEQAEQFQHGAALVIDSLEKLSIFCENVDAFYRLNCVEIRNVDFCVDSASVDRVFSIISQLNANYAYSIYHHDIHYLNRLLRTFVIYI